MKLESAIMGSYPRSTKLAKTFLRFINGKISEDKLNNEIENEMQRIFKILKSFNLDYITNGLLRWDDIADLTFSYISGVGKGELTRFFDNNFYYRKIIVKDKISKNSGKYINYLNTASNTKNKVEFKGKLKGVIVGPITFMQLSEDKYYNDSLELIGDYTKEVNNLLKEIENLVDAIEVHEPSIGEKNVGKEFIERLPEIYEMLFKGIKTEKHLITYFRFYNIDRFNILFKIQTDVYGIDVVENKDKLGQIYGMVRDKEVYLGIIDTKNTRLDRISFIKRVIKNCKEWGAKRLILGNASLLDFIPESVVLRKLELLKKVKENYE
jgi:5-methyltetrahydropteroyltriglutamate--homocysteine methyltransferase